MKIKAFRIKDTGAALLLANRRPDPEQSPPPVEVWVPRSVIPHLKVWGLRPGQEGMTNMVHAEIEGWFVRKTPELHNFIEV